MLWPPSEHNPQWFLQTTDCGERKKREVGLIKPHQGERETTGNVKSEEACLPAELKEASSSSGLQELT